MRFDVKYATCTYKLIISQKIYKRKILQDVIKRLKGKFVTMMILRKISMKLKKKKHESTHEKREGPNENHTRVTILVYLKCFYF